MTRATVLVVDDDERMRTTLEILLRNLEHDVISARDVATAEAILAERSVNLVISDLRMPGGSGMDLLASMRASGRGTPFILVTAYGTAETAVEAMRKGAFDFVVKPFETDEMEARVARALALRR